MSIWSDLQDRSAGETMRREDMQKTINDLTEEIKQLQEANRKLSRQLDAYRRQKQFDDYFREPSHPVWYDDWNDEHTHRGIDSIFKF